jgi:hypothetical protein
LREASCSLAMTSQITGPLSHPRGFTRLSYDEEK